MLFVNESLRGLDIVRQTRDSRDIFISVIAVNDGTGADFQTTCSCGCTRDHIFHLRLQVMQLIAHRTRRIKNEQHVHIFRCFTRLVNNDDLLGHFDHGFRIRCNQVSPQFCFTGVIRHRLEQRVVAVHQGYRIIDHGVSFFINHLHRITLTCIDTPSRDVLFMRTV